MKVDKKVLLKPMFIEHLRECLPGLGQWFSRVLSNKPCTDLGWDEGGKLDFILKEGFDGFDGETGKWMIRKGIKGQDRKGRKRIVGIEMNIEIREG